MTTEDPTAPGPVPPPPPPPPVVPDAPPGTLPGHGGAPLYGTPPPDAAPSGDRTRDRVPTPTGTSPYGTPPPSAAPQHRSSSSAPEGTPVGTAALALGVVAVLLAWVPFVGVLGAGLGLAALVAGAQARSRGRRRVLRPRVGRATAGIVLGSVALVVAVVAQTSYLVVSTSSPGGDAGVDEEVVVPPWEPLTVVEAAFGPEPDRPGAWWYVAVIDNPNPAHRFESTRMSVEALGADGTLIAAESEYVHALPGRTAVTGTFRDLGDLRPDSVDVRLPVVQDVTYAPGVGELTVGELTVDTVSWGVTVEGTVSSTLDEEADFAPVVVVATGRDGEVLAAARGYAEIVPAGGDAPFDASFYETLPAGTTYTAYVSP